MMQHVDMHLREKNDDQVTKLQFYNSTNIHILSDI